MMAQVEASVSEAPKPEFTGLSIDRDVKLALHEPPHPMIQSPGIITVDITREFQGAVATLQPGQLVKDGYFTLFESVGALEIMDPKMDSGCLALGESLDEDYNVTRKLLPSEVLGIIDQLLCLEMAWHLGYPLSQTLLTSVYIEAMLVPEPTRIEEADFIRNHQGDSTTRDPMFVVLRAYCLGLLKVCWYVHERIKFEHYYEEEDFVTNTYHRSLLDKIDRGEIRNELTAARRLVHNLRSRISENIANALDFRLQFRTAFLRALELSELRDNPDSLSLPWSQLQSIWDPINSSRHLGTPVPEAFSTKLQRRLASTIPPRPIVQPSFQETYNHFKRFFADGIEVLQILNYKDSQSLLNFVLAFQSQKPQPLVYIRALLQSLIIKDMVVLGKYSIRQIIDDDLSIVVLPCSNLLDPANDTVEAPHDARFAIAHQMELFRQRVAGSYFEIYRALCMNRCRLRRTLCHSIQDWEMVQMDAEEIDHLLQIQLGEQPSVLRLRSETGTTTGHCLPLSSWVYLYKLRLMEWIVQLGFELDIYQPDELAGMYWYLSSLAKTRLYHAERIQSFTNMHLAKLRAGPYMFSAAKAEKMNRSLDYLKGVLSETTATWELSYCLSVFYTVLGRLDLIASQPSPYSSNELRYEVRMKPFAPIGLPPLPSYENFVRHAAQPGRPTEDLLEEAIAGAQSVERLYEMISSSEKMAFVANSRERWKEDVNNCRKATREVILALSTVKKAFKNGAPGQLRGVEVPKSTGCYHPWWIIPKVSD